MIPFVVLNFSCRSSELYLEQAVSVTAPLNANKLCLSTPALPATCPPRISLGRGESVFVQQEAGLCKLPLLLHHEGS